MHLSLAILGLAATAANGVTIITNSGNKGAAVFTDAFKNTYAIYQRDDNGVSLLKGSILNAQSAAAYTASGLLNPGIARPNTPLAIAIDYSPGNSAVCLHLPASFMVQGSKVLTIVTNSHITSTIRPSHAVVDTSSDTNTKTQSPRIGSTVISTN